MSGKGARRPRSPRSPGMARARRLYAAHAEAARTDVPADEVLGRAGERTRREVLIGAGGLAAGASSRPAPSATTTC